MSNMALQNPILDKHMAAFQRQITRLDETMELPNASTPRPGSEEYVSPNLRLLRDLIQRSIRETPDGRLHVLSDRVAHFSTPWRQSATKPFSCSFKYSFAIQKSSSISNSETARSLR